MSFYLVYIRYLDLYILEYKKIKQKNHTYYKIKNVIGVKNMYKIVKNIIKIWTKYNCMI